MKRLFDIKYRQKIESGEYKVFAGDIPARIVCWDARSASGNDHIVAMVGQEGQPENILRFYNNGSLISDSSNRKNKDLCVITPEPEPLTEFESVLLDAFIARTGEITSSEKYVRLWAPKVLEAAKKEVLKTMPKWRKPKGNKSPGLYTVALGYDDGVYGLFMHCGFVPTTELEKLPRE